ncbi:MAG TPA: hypothetical protein VMT87_09860 [Vicinamibacteria bacterium]|nr:hypothetical protein [Vicinamibacteria bacterium]
MRTLKMAGLLAIVAAAVMVPLYGEVGRAPVTHPEWARMVLRALELEDDLPADATARFVFSTLSWKRSLTYPADRYLRARGVDVVGPPGARELVAANGAGEVAYPLTVVRAGDYRLRVEMAGDPARPGTADITPLGDVRPLREFALAPPAVPGWVEVGTAHLDPGGYSAALTLPAGSALQRVEVAPRCLAAIEPAGGWRDEAVASSEDVAVTALQALDLVWELPPAAAAIEFVATDFRVTSDSPTLGTVAAESGQDGLWLQAGPRGVQALLVVDLPEAGLYTLSTFGPAHTAQGWLVDSCQKAILCPQVAAPAGPAWRPVTTAAFTAGRHSFMVTLPPGAALGRVRLERKKDAAADHVATLRRLGLDPGPPGPVARDRAAAAMEFLRDRRRPLEQTACGDLPPPQALEAGLAEPAVPEGPGQPIVAGQPPGGVGVPLPGPADPAGPPVTVPPVTVPPVTTPPGPPPTVPPAPPPTTPPGPPPTIPPQPPGSPVTPTPPPGD